MVRLCPPLEYILKFQKWWTIPKTTPFLPIKWWLIPKIHTKTYSKWWPHAKYRIQYNHKYVRITNTLYCPPHANKIIKLSILHAHIIKLSTLQNIVNTTLLHSYPHNNIKLSTPSHIVFNTTSLLAQKTIPFQLFHNSIPCKTSTATIISLLLYNLDHSIIMKCHCKAVFADSSEFIYRTIIIFKTPK